MRTVLIDPLYWATPDDRVPVPATSRHDPVSAQQRRGFWLRTLHQWHWISSAVCLVGMLLFTATGITLNHAARIEARPAVDNRVLELPAPLLEALAAAPEDGDAPLPEPVARWLDDTLDVPVGRRPAEWSPEEAYVSMPGPGADAWLSIDRETGAVEFERTDRGWVSYFNDLHKGRNAGPAWGWFIDVFAIACLVFCITGLFLLHLHARQRRLTWPLVGLGLVVPVLLALLFIH
ncbi:PepSY-associated TM helix domain-containing protein [Pseudoxanthomonas suwonensis]|uniref:PepSY-associated TM helix domain-containing protein n=1 Tax=Pseudoxanthomonas suwonensis TaxID=314722 RepID=UPI0009DFD55E